MWKMTPDVFSPLRRTHAHTSVRRWELVAANLAEAGQKALVVNTGYFSDSFVSCLAAYNVQVTQVTCNVGDVCSLADVAAALAKDTYSLICITQVDTSTAVLNDVQGLVRGAGVECVRALRGCGPVMHLVAVSPLFTGSLSVSLSPFIRPASFLPDRPVARARAGHRLACGPGAGRGGAQGEPGHPRLRGRRVQRRRRGARV